MQDDPMTEQRRLRREERREETRARLMAAARTAFLANGYEATSLDSVCEAAGFTKGALYSNFAGKEDLFLHLLQEKLVSDSAAVASLFAAASTYEGALDLLEMFLAERADVLDFTAVAVEFMARLEAGGDSAARCAALYRRQREEIASLLAHLSALAGSGLKDDPERLAAGFVALSLGLATQRRLDRAAISARTWARLSVDLVKSSVSR